MGYRCWVSVFMFAVMSQTEIQAQTLKKTTDFVLGTMDKVSTFFMGCDTNYVTPQKYQFTTQAELSYFADYYRISSSETGRTNAITLESGNPLTLGGYVYWGILGYGHTWTLGDDNESAYRNSFSLNTARFLAEIYTFRSGNSAEIKSVSGVDLKGKPTKFRGLHSDCFGLNAEYIFNHKRYSWPAAFGENAVQRKAAGSWKAGFSYNKIDVELNHDLIDPSIRAEMDSTLIFDKVSYHDYGLSLGYGYNWPFARNCLLAVSVLPTIGYRRSNVFSEHGFILNNLSTDLFFRASLFWNNTKYFTGVVLDIHTYAYRQQKFAMTNSYGTLKFIMGLNFLKKR